MTVGPGIVSTTVVSVPGCVRMLVTVVGGSVAVTVGPGIVSRIVVGIPESVTILVMVSAG